MTTESDRNMGLSDEDTIDRKEGRITISEKSLKDAAGFVLLHNAAPALLDALDFREGDAEKLADIEKWYRLLPQHAEVILRLAAMARKMEAKQE